MSKPDDEGGIRYTEMSADELTAELDAAERGEEPPFRRLGDVARHTQRTVSISVRMPAHLFGDARAESARLGIGYQTL